ncbi:hypothetical protein A2U01_0062493, partial [Trifolium medium]|nr:hypothetical protein [Trifolium medium]
MTSLYLDAINPKNVEPNVVTSTKGSVSSNVVGSVETSKKFAFETVSLDNPRTIESVHVSPSKVVVDSVVGSPKETLP